MRPHFQERLQPLKEPIFGNIAQIYMNSVAISRATRLIEQRRGLSGQLAHRRRFFAQKLRAPKLAVAGGYHFGNLGDMALGEAVRRQLAQLGLPSELQTIYNLSRWPKADALIVGGGAVAYAGPMRVLRETYADRPERVAILGVDFNDPIAVEQSREFLTRAALISVRSASGAQRLRETLGRDDIESHPDLAFSYFDFPFDDASPQDAARAPIFGINAVPFFMVRRGDSFVPGSGFLDEIKRYQPELLPHIDTLGERYSALIRQVARGARAAGFRVIHLPFTPVDESFARSVLGDLEVDFRPYTPHPLTRLNEVRSCQRIFTSRFHSLIFALVTRTPFASFAYATKCDRLLDDLEVAPERRLSVAELLGDTDALARRAVEGPTPQIAWPTVEAMGREAAAAIERAAKKIVPANP